jgi:hypothetical protein
VEDPTWNSSRVLITGNAAERIRVRALDSSRALISASMSVRRNSGYRGFWTGIRRQSLLSQVNGVLSGLKAEGRIAVCVTQQRP